MTTSRPLLAVMGAILSAGAALARDAEPASKRLGIGAESPPSVLRLFGGSSRTVPSEFPSQTEAGAVALLVAGKPALIGSADADIGNDVEARAEAELKPIVAGIGTLDGEPGRV